MPFNIARAYNAGTDGFAPPAFGGTVAVKSGSLVFSDSGAKVLFTLPAGAVIVDFTVFVKTAFNAGTTNNIDLGLGATGDALANNLAGGTAGVLRAGSTGTVLTSLGVELTEDTVVSATYEQSGTAATAGAALIYVWYVIQ